MPDPLNDALEAAFAEATRRYRERGFQRRVGFGRKPALINVDLANAWTRPGNPFTCEHMDDQVIPAVQKLLGAFRRHGFPVVHVTTCYQVTDRNNPNTDMGLWHHKIPVEVVAESDRNLWQIDSRIAPIAGEQLLIKKRASAFQWCCSDGTAALSQADGPGSSPAALAGAARGRAAAGGDGPGR